MAELSSNEHFQKTIATAGDQLKNKKIQVRFGPQGKMRFIIDEDGLRTALATPSASGLSEETFREIFHNEIGPLLEAVIRDGVDQYIEAAQVTTEGQKGDRDARKAVLKERAEVVKKVLATEELRARYLIKTSSKHPRLREANWEVARKVALPNMGSISRPYATLNFETVWPEPLGALLWFPFFPNVGGRTESVSFDCDEGDLDDLIKTLQEAKAALGKTIA
jgi:hypothetical protein